MFGFDLRTGVCGDRIVAVVDGVELADVPAGAAAGAKILVDDVRSLRRADDALLGAVAGTHGAGLTGVRVDAEREVAVQRSVFDLLRSGFLLRCGSSCAGSGGCGSSGFRAVSGGCFLRSGRGRSDIALVDGIELTGIEAGAAADALVLIDLVGLFDFAFDGAGRAGLGTHRTAFTVVLEDLDGLIGIELGSGCGGSDGAGRGSGSTGSTGGSSAFGSSRGSLLGRSFVIRIVDHFDDIERAGFRADTAADAVFFTDEFRKGPSHTAFGDGMDEVEGVYGAVEETALTTVALRMVEIRDLFRVTQRKTPPLPYS